MIDIRIVAVGKPAREYKEVLLDYEKRFSKYCRFEVFEVRKELDIASKIRGKFVLLDLSGKQQTSVEFSKFIKENEKITFAIGPADGFSQDILDRADSLICLSEMTLPHQMARLFLTEQIYRAFTILKGEKYHK